MPEHLRRHVHEEVQKRNAGAGSIGLQAYGTVTSDGYRPGPDLAAVISTGMEQNITTLMNMGLANRARALQALEALGNNLPRAVDMLLALQAPAQPAQPFIIDFARED